MPILLLTVFFQILCGIHVVKTGQEKYWIYLIIILPALGCAIYVIAIIIPELLASYKGQQVIKKVQKKIAPTRDLRTLRNQLEISDNVESRTNLADELVNLKQYDEALIHYKAALAGIHSENPEILLKLAFVQFNVEQYQACQQTLDFLIQHNPNFRSQEGHLLYARAVEAVGDSTKAEQEYETLVSYYPGPEARYYYANFLSNQHRSTEAIKQLEEIQTYANVAPIYYKNIHKHCLSKVRKLYRELTQPNTKS